MQYEGVILAAGRGTRMGYFGDHYPKALVPVCNIPMIKQQLLCLHSMGIRDAVVVVGYMADEIKNYVGNGSRWDMNVRFVEQTERLGLAHAVGQLEQHLTKPFVLILGDIFYQMTDPTLLLREYELDLNIMAVIAVKEEPDLDALRRNFVVYQSEGKGVTRVVEKPRHILNNSHRNTPFLKGCGIYVFDPTIFDAIRRTPRTALRDEYELTDSIQVLIDLGYRVEAVLNVDTDINLTSCKDILDANLLVLSQSGKQNLQGKGCEIAEGSEFRKTVIGQNVIIKDPVCLERCVVFSDSVITGTEKLENKIITPHGRFDATE